MQINRKWLNYLKDYNEAIVSMFWAGDQLGFSVMCDELDTSGHPAAAALIRDQLQAGNCTREMILRVFSIVKQNQNIKCDGANFFWTTQEGKKLRWTEMDDDHIVNVTLMLCRSRRVTERDPTRIINNIMPVGLILELSARKLWDEVKTKWNEYCQSRAFGELFPNSRPASVGEHVRMLDGQQRLAAAREAAHMRYIEQSVENAQEAVAREQVYAHDIAEYRRNNPLATIAEVAQHFNRSVDWITSRLPARPQPRNTMRLSYGAEDQVDALRYALIVHFPEDSTNDIAQEQDDDAGRSDSSV
jgi:hypothetical protein